MKRIKKAAGKKLELRRESLRQLQSTALEQVAGGAKPAPVPDGYVFFDLAEYLRRCMGTGS